MLEFQLEGSGIIVLIYPAAPMLMLTQRQQWTSQYHKIGSCTSKPICATVAATKHVFDWGQKKKTMQLTGNRMAKVQTLKLLFSNSLVQEILPLKSFACLCSFFDLQWPLQSGWALPKKKAPLNVSAILISLNSLRNEWEVVRTECDALGEGTTNCQHGQSSIFKLLHLHALHALSRGRGKTS